MIFPRFVDANDPESNEKFQRVRLVFGVIMGSLCIVTAVGNICVIYIYRKASMLGNLFIISLAIADLIVGSFVMPVATIYAINDVWIFSQPVCILWLSADYIASTASILNLLALSIDRYMAITSPLQSLSVRTKSFALTMITLAWLISFLWVLPITTWHIFFPPPPTSPHHNDELLSYQTLSLPPQTPTLIGEQLTPSFSASSPSPFLPLLPANFSSLSNSSSSILSPPSSHSSNSLDHDIHSHHHDDYHHHHPQCTPAYDKSIYFKVGTGIFNFYVPLIALIAINVRIFLTIRRSTRQSDRSNSGDNNGPSDPLSNGGHIKIRRIHRNNKQEKAFRTLVLIVVGFTVCFTPYFTVYIVVALCENCISTELFTVTLWLGYLNSTLNPFLYALSNRRHSNAGGSRGGKNASYHHHRNGAFHRNHHHHNHPYHSQHSQHHDDDNTLNNRTPSADGSRSRNNSRTPTLNQQRQSLILNNTISTS